MFDRAQIMKNAWYLFRTRPFTSFADALRYAWMIAKGYTHAIQISVVVGYTGVVERYYFPATSVDDSTKRRIMATKTLLTQGRRTIGSEEFNLIIAAGLWFPGYDWKVAA